MLTSTGPIRLLSRHSDTNLLFFIVTVFQARLADAEALMKDDVVLLAHEDSHSGHELKFYKKY